MGLNMVTTSCQVSTLPGLRVVPTMVLNCLPMLFIYYWQNDIKVIEYANIPIVLFGSSPKVSHN